MPWRSTAAVALVDQPSNSVSNGVVAPADLATSAPKATSVTNASKTKAPQGGVILQSDPWYNFQPASLVGQHQCRFPTRVTWFPAGGPNNDPFRRTTVLSGDNYYGSRAQLGENDWRGSFWVYHQGDHTDTDFDVRLPANFPINGALGFQQIMQMKQAQPSNNGGVDSPRIELDAYNGDWRLRSDLDSTSDGFWTTPAHLNVWTHVHMDVLYSDDPTKGYVNITIGDFTSPIIHMATLVPEIAGPSHAIAVGAPIPSVLMLGIYHSAAYGPTSADYSNVMIRSA